jgi:hypothetical protein
MTSLTEEGSQRAFTHSLFKRDFADFWKLALPNWFPFSVIGLSVVITSLIFLWPNPVEFPMDDTYIHFVYARNLSEQGELMFNEPGEKGVGTSSLLWVLLLAGGNRIGIPLYLLAKILGITSLIVLGMGIYLLLRPICSSLLALTGSLFVVLSGHMLWFALSGMETVLFLALGILALLCYRDQHWGWLGVLLGLLTLTRLEGVLLGISIGVIDGWRYRSIRRGLFMAGIVCVLISGPWVVYLLLRTGHALPTSGIGKRFGEMALVQSIFGRYATLTYLKWLIPLSFPLIWFLYTIEFVLGGAALPQPFIHINPGLGSLNYELSVWALAGWVLVIAPLLWISVRRVVRFFKKPGWCADEQRLPLVIFLFWIVLHNLSYMVYLPLIGTASRYVALNHVALWIALVSGLWLVRRLGFKVWLVGGLITLALANTVYWNKVYDANLEHMRNVRIAGANFVRKNTSLSERCAAFDIGAVRYYSERSIIDLGGLIDPGLSKRYLDGDIDRYLVEKGVTCLVLSGRTGTIEDSFVDFAKILGLCESPLFTMQQVAVFQIDREQWLLGYLPVMNYQATVSIYRLEYNQRLTEEGFNNQER